MDLLDRLVTRWPALGLVLGALPYLFISCLSAWLATWIVSAHKDLQIAALELSLVQQDETAARERSLALAAATRRSDELIARLAEAEQAAHDQKRVFDDEIKKATRGRACLGAAALQLLDSAPGIAAPAGVPPPVGSAAPASAGGAAADPQDEGAEVATDTDIATWAGDAGSLYRTCAARLDALIDFHQPQELR